MNVWFALAYALLMTALVVVELIGVRRKNKSADGDTITEGWRWLDRRMNGWARWLWRLLTIGFLGWTILHLTVHL